MKTAIVGCGLIGNKRADVITQSPNDKLVIVADIDAPRAEQLACEHNCQATTDWEQAVNHPQVDAVIVATVNKFLAPITIAALERGKHVLVEKPMARNLAEAEQVLQAAVCRPRSAVGVGFNHRHHPAIWQAHEICARGEIGPLLFVRAIYGHGGRPGYDKEWRADADLAGGGELLDQGVHIVDLCRWFLVADPRKGGDFAEAFSFTNTYF
ncbi:MAG: Gfo/Idh/MocA family oxidoreductase [Chloroflexota bacterium]